MPPKKAAANKATGSTSSSRVSSARAQRNADLGPTEASELLPEEPTEPIREELNQPLPEEASGTMEMEIDLDDEEIPNSEVLEVDNGGGGTHPTPIVHDRTPSAPI